MADSLTTNMKKINLLKYLSISIVVLVGCKDENNELTPDNLTKAIDKYYQNFCIVPSPAPHNGAKPFPVQVKKGPSGLFISEKETETNFKNDIKSFDAFKSVGLLDKEGMTNSEGEITGYRYAPTLEGKKYLQNDSSLYICAGNYQVTNIVKINPPIENAFKEVEVTFTYNAINISPWVNNKVIKETFPLLQQQLSPKEENTKMVRLRNDVWVVIN
ncbi:hypothetical protein AYY17_00430 [Morganella psychrotolerans]|uniref:Uncharacterized protein n=2 Tax=Morganella psychrotolerans TaxID=368603 RepID=A0A1B8HP52_9GAMM|nr:hypothetical protein AYY17_00430 [Morganella psychrotolerans]